jgi:hypothetical protein
MKHAEHIEDTLVLDIGSLLDSLPFTKKTALAIRRVDGATQYFRDDSGMYRVVLNGNIFNTGNPVVVLVDDLPQPRDGTAWSHPTPPYELALQIPAKEVNGLFQDRTLAYLPLVVRAQVSNRNWFFQFWKPAYRTAEFKVKVELFPRYPVQYRLTEYRTEKTLDKCQEETEGVTVTGHRLGTDALLLAEII